MELIGPCQVTLISERRVSAPYGLAGGLPGTPGRNWLVRNGRADPLPGQVTLACQDGDLIRVETPGGGGWGPPESDED